MAYANYSVEGNDGYKLYDDDAVEKLQQIALYYQLGLKRNEIRDIMLDPDYDRNLVLESLLEQERIKKVRTERHIAAVQDSINRNCNYLLHKPQSGFQSFPKKSPQT